MINLIYIIPIAIIIFIFADAMADSFIRRKEGVKWITFHIFTWIRRYILIGFLFIIWFYVAGINSYTISVILVFMAFLTIAWKVIFLFNSKRLVIKKLDYKV